MLRARANPDNVERLLLDTAAQDGTKVRIGFSQDPGQAGESQAQHLVRVLSGFSVTPAAESGDDGGWFESGSLHLRGVQTF
ncbi:MAG: hypothetical protein JO320_01645 [Alphaproteobacteria bacterium]|nr:hypothetical protein [Alphaproteobacteria bacterium]MBV9816164.1 hypothetical protein [Alphaproteobacteria bacterium]